jgi:putative acetyltransferase
MPLTIRPESPLTDDAHRLIDGSERALRAVYPPEECFSFSAAQLDDPAITFLVARQDGAAVGGVALVNYQSYGEGKRLCVLPQARGLGAARALMIRLESLSRALGHEQIMLETGEKLAAAVALYRDLGFVPRGPFGTYEDIPASLFMTKSLS